MAEDIDPEILYVNATIEGLRPFVYWAYQGRDGSLTVAEARAQARQLFVAGAIAESEAAIVRGVREVPSKGFAKPSRAEQQKANEVSAALLQMIRQYRPPLPDGLQVIFGHKTQLPLIVIAEGWYGAAMQLDVADAEGHAMHLLGAAEAAESDAFLYYFQEEQFGLSRAEANALVQDLGLFRQRNALEDLLGRD